MIGTNLPTYLLHFVGEEEERGRSIGLEKLSPPCLEVHTPINGDKLPARKPLFEVEVEVEVARGSTRS